MGGGGGEVIWGFLFSLIFYLFIFGGAFLYWGERVWGLGH